MTTTFTIKHGDTLPELEVQLFSDAELTSPVNLTNATQAALKIGSPLVLDAVMTISDAANGIIKYQFTTVDWNTVGPETYDMEFEITWNDGSIRTYPLKGYATLIVNPDLDG